LKKGSHETKLLLASQNEELFWVTSTLQEIGRVAEIGMGDGV